MCTTPICLFFMLLLLSQDLPSQSLVLRAGVVVRQEPQGLRHGYYCLLHHPHLHILEHTCTYLNILAHTCIYHTCTCLHMLAHTCTYLHILAHTKPYSYHAILMYHVIPCCILHCPNHMLHRPSYLLVLLHLVLVFHGHNKCIPCAQQM